VDERQTAEPEALIILPVNRPKAEALGYPDATANAKSNCNSRSPSRVTRRKATAMATANYNCCL
jgi:hypothetical protein